MITNVIITSLPNLGTVFEAIVPDNMTIKNMTTKINAPTI